MRGLKNPGFLIRILKNPGILTFLTEEQGNFLEEDYLVLPKNPGI
jgi:hypothetical protein